MILNLSLIFTKLIFLKSHSIFYFIHSHTIFHLHFHRFIIQGTTLLNPQQQKTVFEWIGKKKTELLYRATRDGFDASIFHNKCDNKGPTIVIIKSQNNYLFGGYAATHWDQSGTYKTAAGCFLFTLTNSHNIPPTRFMPKATQHMFCNAGYGPTFGGHDLYVQSNANASNGSFTSLGQTYTDSTGLGQSLFTGAYAFMAAEIEVLSVY